MQRAALILTAMALLVGGQAKAQTFTTFDLTWKGISNIASAQVHVWACPFLGCVKKGCEGRSNSDE